MPFNQLCDQKLLTKTHHKICAVPRSGLTIMNEQEVIIVGTELTSGTVFAGECLKVNTVDLVAYGQIY